MDLTKRWWICRWLEVVDFGSDKVSRFEPFHSDWHFSCVLWDFIGQLSSWHSVRGHNNIFTLQPPTTSTLNAFLAPCKSFISVFVVGGVFWTESSLMCPTSIYCRVVLLGDKLISIPCSFPNGIRIRLLTFMSRLNLHSTRSKRLTIVEAETSYCPTSTITGLHILQRSTCPTPNK